MILKKYIISLDMIFNENIIASLTNNTDISSVESNYNNVEN